MMYIEEVTNEIFFRLRDCNAMIREKRLRDCNARIDGKHQPVKNDLRRFENI